MTCGPNTQISPTASVATSLPSSSRIETSVEGIGSPILPLKSTPIGFAGARRRGRGQSPPLSHHAAGDLLPSFGDDTLQGHATGKRHPQGAEVHGFEPGRI